LIVLVTFNFPAFLGCLFPGVVDNSVKADVHGIIQGLPIPWPLHDPNACHLSGLTCPLQPGNNYHYTATFPVLKTYPKVSSSLQTEYVFMPYQIVAVFGRLGGGTRFLRPSRTSPPGKTRYPLHRRLGGPQGQSGWAENLAPTGIRSPDRPAHSQSLYRLSYPTH